MHLRRKKTKTDLLREQVGDLTDKATDLSRQAATTLAPRVEQAREAAVAAYDTASHKVRDEYAPKVRDEYVPRAQAKVRDDYVPRAQAKAAPVVTAALAKAAALTPGIEEPKPKKKNRLRKVLLFLGIGAGVAYVAARLTGQSGSNTPPPRPTPVPSPPPPPNPAAAPTGARKADPESGEGTEASSKPEQDGGDSNPAGDDTAADPGR